MYYFSQQYFTRILPLCSHELVESTFQLLQSHYNEPHRFYHNAQHIELCLTLLKNYENLAGNINNIALAIFFHDVIYDTKKSDNEEKSAALAMQCLQKSGLPKEDIQIIYNMILATKTHISYTPDEKLMLDIDLSILGSVPAVFKVYDAQIRQEYAWVAKSEYQAARKRVLNNFLLRDRIYQVDVFVDRYEVQARKNITQEMKGL